MRITGLAIVCSVLAAYGGTRAEAEGYALQFDGGDVVKIFDNSDFRDRSGITIEFWVRYHDPENNGYIIDQFGASPPNTGEWAIMTRSECLAYYFRWPGETHVYSLSHVTDGTWHHVCFSKSGHQLNIYVDGQHDVYANLGSSQRFDSAVTMYLGSRGHFEQYFIGELDELRIWDYDRSAEEVAATYHTTVDPDTPGLLAYWRFDEEADDQNVYDLSPRGNHGCRGESLTANEDDPVRVLSLVPADFTGDMNCDDLVDFDDIAPFLLALMSEEEYETAYPDCVIGRADCNKDGSIDFDDIQPFISLLGS